MTSLTLKNLPDSLVRSLREAAGNDRRSLTQEIIYLLDSALRGRAEKSVQPTLPWEINLRASGNQMRIWKPRPSG